MKNILFIVLTVFIPLYAFHNLTITPSIARAGIDTLTFNGNYEHGGDTALITALFCDINGNGNLDNEDVDFVNGQPIQLIDGGTPGGYGPFDELRDSIFHMLAPAGGSPFNSIGAYVCIISSNGLADTAFFSIIEPASNTYIKGVLNDPDGNPADGVAIRVDVLDNSSSIIYSTYALTATDGSLVINLRDSYRNHPITLSLDPTHSATGSIEADWVLTPLDTIIVDSLLILHGEFKRDVHVVTGTVTDEHGKPVVNKAFYLDESGGLDRKIPFTTDNAGKFTVKAASGTYDMSMDDRNGQIDYLYNAYGFTIPAQIDTVRTDYQVMNADTIISGMVYDNGTLSGNGKVLEISVTGIKNSKNFKAVAYIHAQGKYSIKVNSTIDTYNVVLNLHGFSEEYTVFQQYYYPVKPGTDTCNAYIKRCTAHVSGTIQDSSGAYLSGGSCFFVDQSNGLKIAVNSNGSGQFGQMIPAGVYKLYYTGFCEAINEYVGGIFGPITISDRDTVLELYASINGYTQGTKTRTKNTLSGNLFSFTAIKSRDQIGFTYAVPVNGSVRIGLYDLSGRLIAPVVKRNVDAGVYRLNLNRNSVSFSQRVLIAKMEFTGTKNFSKSIVIK